MKIVEIHGTVIVPKHIIYMQKSVQFLFTMQKVKPTLIIQHQSGDPLELLFDTSESRNKIYETLKEYIKGEE
jgi:hypothetical protein